MRNTGKIDDLAKTAISDRDQNGDLKPLGVSAREFESIQASKLLKRGDRSLETDIFELLL